MVKGFIQGVSLAFELGKMGWGKKYRPIKNLWRRKFRVEKLRLENKRFDNEGKLIFVIIVISKCVYLE